MTEYNNCDCIELQPKGSTPVKLCSNDLGKLLFGAVVLTGLFVIIDKLSE
jgi:hypothetical protein